MPELKNARHERFAQLVVSGKAQATAYLEAGFKGSESAARANAARLIATDSVRARVSELQRKGEAKALVTREMVITGLLALAQADEGVPAAVRRSAWRDLGEHLSMFKMVVDYRRVEELAEQLGLDPSEVQAEAEAILKGTR